MLSECFMEVLRENFSMNTIIETYQNTGNCDNDKRTITGATSAANTWHFFYRGCHTEKSQKFYARFSSRNTFLFNTKPLNSFSTLTCYTYIYIFYI